MQTEKETQMYRIDFWILWEKARVGCSERLALKQVCYQGWNRSPVQVGCMKQVLGAGALGRPRGMGWGGRWEGGSGWDIHVNPWLIHVNVWQNPLWYCKVINLQLIKKKKKEASLFILPWNPTNYLVSPGWGGHSTQALTQFSPIIHSIQFSRSVVSNSLWPHEPQHARPPCLSPTPGVHPNPCSLIQWCHPTISSSVVPFSSCPQSFQASRSFQMSQLFASGIQSIGVSASTSVLPMNTQEDTHGCTQ